MRISSTAFGDGQSIPRTYTCDGADISPPLAFAGVPARTKSLVLAVDDPDAPGGTFDHWIVWNVPPGTVSLGGGQTPKGVAGRNGFGRNAWGGPCPPSGVHRYRFKLYALDTALSLPPSSEKSAVERAMKGHVLAEASIVGRYKR